MPFTLARVLVGSARACYTSYCRPSQYAVERERKKEGKYEPERENGHRVTPLMVIPRQNNYVPSAIQAQRVAEGDEDEDLMGHR